MCAIVLVYQRAVELCFVRPQEIHPPAPLPDVHLCLLLLLLVVVAVAADAIVVVV
eukprot:m.309181 g.309181  ORF g.309181 m.309181 type:complete len:55 (+) comp15945_c0_seq5:3053-3217(+)